MTQSTRRIVLPGDPLRDGPTALRPWRDSDAEPMAELCQDPAIARFTRVPARYSIHDARNFLRTRHDLSHAGVSASFAIIAAGDQVGDRVPQVGQSDLQVGDRVPQVENSDLHPLIGSISLMHIAWPDRRAEVGYWVGAEFRSRGHATRAVGLVCAWGMRTLGLERIELLAAVQNPASQAVARRAGFTEEARLRSFLEAGDGSGRQDMICFGLLAGDRE